MPYRPPLHPAHQEILEDLLTLGHLPAITARAAIRRVLEAIMLSAPGSAAFVGYLDPAGGRFWIVDAEGDPSFTLAPFDHLPIETSFCQAMTSGAAPQLANLTAEAPGYRDLSVRQALGIGAYLGVPLRDLGGRPWGSLCLLDHAPFAFTMSQHRLLAAAARLLAGIVERERADRAEGGRPASLGAVLGIHPRVRSARRDPRA